MFSIARNKLARLFGLRFRGDKILLQVCFVSFLHTFHVALNTASCCQNRSALPTGVRVAVRIRPLVSREAVRVRRPNCGCLSSDLVKLNREKLNDLQGQHNVFSINLGPS